jgi:tetratricopeptide (TPR) repeat protein
MGEVDAEKRHWQEQVRLAQRLRDATLETQAAGRAELQAMIEGRIEEALSLSNQQEAGSSALGIASPGAAQRRARALLWLGRPAEALPGFAGTGRQAQIYKSVMLAHLGRAEEARAIRDRFASGFDSDEDESSINVLAALLEAAVIIEDNAAAAALEKRLRPLAGRCLWIYGLCIGRLCGGAAKLLRRPDEARGYYNQALAVCEKVRFRPEIALTRVELAELLLEHYPDERPTAIEHLDFAIREFREMKMQPSLERALRHRELLKA